MSDPPLSTTTICAVSLWILAFALAGVYAATGLRGLGVFAVLVMGGGATLTVRRYLLKMCDDLLTHERQAFQAGLDAQRIRSVD